MTAPPDVGSNPFMNMLRLWIGTVVLLVNAALVSGDEPAPPARASSGVIPAGTTADVRPSREQARRQAEILHTAVHSTLRSVHDRYYRLDTGLPIPAAVLREVFADLEKEQRVTLRWLAVDGQAMNDDHRPRDGFEADAVKALKGGAQQLERVENGLYRRAGAITLSNHCLKCHVPNRKSTEDRTAGLVIAIRITEK